MKKSTSTRRSQTPAKVEPASPALATPAVKDQRKTKSVSKSKGKNEQTSPSVKGDALVKETFVKQESA